jgi:hypothetical protein
VASRWIDPNGLTIRPLALTESDLDRRHAEAPCSENEPATLLVVLGVWLLQLLLSPLYVKDFQIGPVEWLWRSAARWQLVPILKRA